MKNTIMFLILFYKIMMNKKTYIGSHASMAKGFSKAIQDELDISGNAVQVFLKNPRGRVGKPLDLEEAKKTKALVEEKDVFLVGHCSYLLNFAKPFEEFHWSVDSLIDDLERIYHLGGKGVVLHIGKFLEYSHAEAFKNIVDNINKVLDKSPKETYVVWENTAGQGTEIGYKLEELAELYEAIGKHPRIKFCLDTCHAFAAGYDLSNEEGVQNWYAKFDKLIGWDNVHCIHFNDTKKACGSRVDRHEVLKQGMIGEAGLKAIARLAAKTNKPIILETPNEMTGYEKEIAIIKEWIG